MRTRTRSVHTCQVKFFVRTMESLAFDFDLN